MAAVVVQTCLGSVYAWSVFATPLQEAGIVTPSQGQLVFGLLVAGYVTTMFGLGRTRYRLRFRILVFASAVLFGGGYLLAGLFGSTLPGLILGVSLLAGMGTGSGYLAALGGSVRAVPERKGLVTGLAVMGFGGGAILVSQIASPAIEAGVTPQQGFLVLGMVGGGAILLTLLAPWRLVEGTAEEKPAPLQWNRNVALASLGLFSGTVAGLVVVGSMTGIVGWMGYASGVGSLAVAAFSVGNASGRVIWGAVFDKVAEKGIPVKLTLLTAAALGLLVLRGLGLPAAVWALVLVVGFGFGGCLVMYVAFLVKRQGQEAVSSLYPTAFLFHGAGALVGPPLGGWLFERTGSYVPAILLSASAAAAALVVWGLFLRSEATAKIES